jgi:signal peptidase I
LSTLDERAPSVAHPPGRRAASGLDSDLDYRPAADPEEPISRSSVAIRRIDQGKALLWEIAQTVLLTIAIFLSVRLVVQNFRVEGASMDPTLRSGQFLLINKVTYARVDGTPIDPLLPARNDRGTIHYVFGGPNRGDVIVFRSPGSPDKDFIKRVIGLPGESVRIVDGRVFVNGREIDEPYLTHHATYDLETKKIPSDSFFVLGDNRPNSSDSHLGWFVPADSIIGRAWVSYWPPDLWGVVSTSAYANLD